MLSLVIFTPYLDQQSWPKHDYQTYFFSLENISENFGIHFQNDEEINNDLFFKAWTEVKYMIPR